MKQKGFTLIELLVLIAIVGILIVIVVSSISRAKNKAACKEGNDEACQKLSQEQREEIKVYKDYPEKVEPKKQTDLDRAKKICPDGILEFSGDPDSTYKDTDFTVKCK